MFSPSVNEREVRWYRPQYWCENCDVGQSIPRCWLCGEACGLTRGHDKKADGTDKWAPGSIQARSMNSTMQWNPEGVGPDVPVGVTAAIDYYDGEVGTAAPAGADGPVGRASSETAASNAASRPDTSGAVEGPEVTLPFGVTV